VSAAAASTRTNPLSTQAITVARVEVQSPEDLRSTPGDILTSGSP
jgi:hypothetical protein